MLSPKSRFRLSLPDPQRLVFHTSPFRRILFGAMAAVLLAAFLVGGNWGNGLSGEPALGIIFFAILFLVSLGVAGFESKTEFVLDTTGELRMRSSIFGFPLRKRREALDERVSIVLRQIKLMDEKHFAPRSKMLQTMLERRAAIYRLYIEIDDELVMLEDSSDYGQLEQAARRIADFTGRPYRHEHV